MDCFTEAIMVLKAALAEHDHKAKMQVMLTDPHWVAQARDVIERAEALDVC